MNNQNRVENIRSMDLPTGAIIKVMGTVAYSHITKLYTQEEYEKRVSEAIARGNRYPRQRTYREITLENPQIIMENSNGQGYTIAESYIQQKFYKKADGTSVFNFQTSGDNSNYFHIERDVNGNITSSEKFTPEGEFDKGSAVVLIMNVYQPKGQANKGVGLYSLVVDGPLNYYGRSDKLGLAELGIDVDQIIDNTSETEINTPAVEEQPVVTNGFGVTPQHQPQGDNTFGNQPQGGYGNQVDNAFGNQPQGNGFANGFAAPVQNGFTPQEFVADQGNTAGNNTGSNPYSNR